MTLESGKITGRRVAKNMDSEIATQLLQVSLVEDNDSQEVEEMHIPGFQYRPPTGARGFVARVTQAWKICVGIDDLVPKLSILEGEAVFYASSAGVIKSKIHVKIDGSIDIETLSSVNVVGDVIADGISLKNHLHIGNLGGTVSAPQMGSVAVPNPALPGVGIDVGANEVTANGKTLSTHTHSQANDSGGDVESNTSAPL
jgi:phage gp45-like